MAEAVNEKPFVEEAGRRVAGRRKERGAEGTNLRFHDDTIAQLMADYAAEVWQCGYDEGIREGWNAGYAAAENDQ